MPFLAVKSQGKRFPHVSGTVCGAVFGAVLGAGELPGNIRGVCRAGQIESGKATALRLLAAAAG